MSTQVMVTLADDVFQQADQFARLAGRQVGEVLSDAIALSLRPLGPLTSAAQPVSQITDGQVLSLVELQMEPSQDARLSALLDRQQAGQLAESERQELMALMQVYQEGLLRKAQGLREAVRRGLRAPLDP